ncbi:MAG: dTDP-4-dehydrorhamnose 3,5-epimerase family protein [Bacteroidia bacterium]
MLDGVVEIQPDRFGDKRGFFAEMYNRNSLKPSGWVICTLCRTTFPAPPKA